ncbi:hypothetical protein NQ317_004823 [Molorchus minor]|uniref:Uncharacterized protein n=1 Tax=Molorchus minor TaxID=1323400 RepID=A0ABQ9IVV5_9CUCU|nr:hypothetical protein NQ317_004823 [Molorchus minor]
MGIIRAKLGMPGSFQE